MNTPRKPMAFDPDKVDVAVAEPDMFDAEPDLARELDSLGMPVPAGEAVPVVPRRRRWLGVLLSAVGGLIALAIGLAVDNLIRDLFARNDWLGWLALALAAIAALALVVLAVREIAGLIRLRRINHIHERALAVVAERRPQGRARRPPRTERPLPQPARHRPRPRGARPPRCRDHRRPRSHRHSPRPNCCSASTMPPAAWSSRRPSGLPSSPPSRPALWSTCCLSARKFSVSSAAWRRFTAAVPARSAFSRLTRAAISHLAITGGMAAGDSLVSQILGHGLAARLSARLGEGVVNGLLTARVGIAAIEVCRPLPFVNGRPPRLGDVMAELSRLTSKSAG